MVHLYCGVDLYLTEILFWGEKGMFIRGGVR